MSKVVLNSCLDIIIFFFSIYLFKGRRESSWSMSDFNSTMPAPSVSPPRDLTIQTDDVTKESVTLQWQPPKQSNGPITGTKKFHYKYKLQT